ncbi:MAG: hypothetical protein OXU96_01510 [Gammaproteobacteria bacterium]|nr:hypothetical protein [Gammaproteobacteria bacterium]
MSNAFALPIAISVSPRRRIAALVTALHCVPLPLLMAVDGAWRLAAAVAVAASLAVELHQQRRAGSATRLATTAGNEWLLYRGAAPGGKIELIDSADYGRFALLLVAQRGRPFHLLINARAQSGEQWHRLRVWLAHRTGDGPGRL